MIRFLIFLFGFILLFSSPLFSETISENLPPILEVEGGRPFEVLTPLGAGKSTIEEAKTQLRREAKKVDADAIIRVRCEPGGIRRDGLNWVHQEAYCRGKAIRFLKQ